MYVNTSCVYVENDYSIIPVVVTLSAQVAPVYSSVHAHFARLPSASSREHVPPFSHGSGSQGSTELYLYLNHI